MLSQSLSRPLIPLLLLVSAACATRRVRTDYSPGAAFSELETYSWLTWDHLGDGEPALDSPLLGRRIRSSVDRVLSDMGYRKVSSGEPDFRVAYRATSEVRAAVEPSYGYDPYFGYSGFGYPDYGYYALAPFGFGLHGFGLSRFHHRSFSGYGGAGTREMLRGTLVLEVFDVRKDELVWRGWTSGTFSLDPEPEEVAEFAEEAVRRILAEFPPERGLEVASRPVER